MKRLPLTLLLFVKTAVSAIIGPDGTGTYSGYYIGPNANLYAATLRYAHFNNANLSQANLFLADLTESELINANLTEANLSLATLNNTDFTDANLSSANFYSADLTGANFSGANLNGADFSLTPHFNQVRSGNITGTPVLPNGGRYQIINGYIIGENVDLTGANLSEANLSNVNLSGANLTNANLTDANAPQQQSRMVFVFLDNRFNLTPLFFHKRPIGIIIPVAGVLDPNSSNNFDT